MHNPRDNKARFIRHIRILVDHPGFSKLGIDLERLVQPGSAKGITNPLTLSQMQKLCDLMEGSGAFILKETNADDHAALMSFKRFNSGQWKEHIQEAMRAKKASDLTSPENKQPNGTPVTASKKNTRRRIDPLSALTLDVDLQQQTDIYNSFQLQSLQSTEYQNEQQHQINTSGSKDPAISFEEFWAMLIADASLAPLSVTKDDLHYQWCHWTGGQNTFSLDPEYPQWLRRVKRTLIEGDIQFTRSAAMELFKWRHLFQAGVDIHYLPFAFTVIKSKDDRNEEVYLVNHIPKLKEVVEPDKLAIQCKPPLSFPAGTKPDLTLEEVTDLFKKDHFSISEDSIKHLYQHVLKYFPDKETLQKNEECMQSIRTILNLTPSQRVWWEQLFEQHTKNCGLDDMPSLVTSFQEFIDQITHYHQYFDFYPPKFSNIKSMPVALTQMLALLDRSKNEDRQIQWNCITELNLTGYEVGATLRIAYFSRAFFNEIQKPCGFILPIMNVKELKEFEDGMSQR